MIKDFIEDFIDAVFFLIILAIMVFCYYITRY